MENKKLCSDVFISKAIYFIDTDLFDKHINQAEQELKTMALKATKQSDKETKSFLIALSEFQKAFGKDIDPFDLIGMIEMVDFADVSVEKQVEVLYFANRMILSFKRKKLSD